MSINNFLCFYNEYYTNNIAIDTNIYSKNQQFRFFNSMKYGQNNSLTLSNVLSFEKEKDCLLIIFYKKNFN